MTPDLFDPFASLDFGNNTCFLTGKKLDGADLYFVPVFPQWLMERYDLEDKELTMLNWNKMKYGELVLPVCEEVMLAIQELDDVTQKAFEKGYDAVKEMPELTIFQWMARVMYGVLYFDLRFTIQKKASKGRLFQASPLLERKFKNLLFMLHSLIRPVKFDGFIPWSMKCNPVKISKDILNYKDETHKLNFCLNMNGFGIVACLQDNGGVKQYHEDILKIVGDKELHPAQFEELYGHFIYANYIMREMPEGYQISLDEDEETLVFRLPEQMNKEMPEFAEWDDALFAQVLFNAWDPWGIPVKQIHVFPNSPISYLVDEFTQEFIPFEKVNLDY